MVDTITVTDAMGNEWTCTYVVTAGGGVASGESELPTEGQSHYWNCKRGSHVRTLAMPSSVDFRGLSDSARLEILEKSFNISGEWERQ